MDLFSPYAYTTSDGHELKLRPLSLGIVAEVDIDDGYEVLYRAMQESILDDDGQLAFDSPEAAARGVPFHLAEEIVREGVARAMRRLDVDAPLPDSP